jgi:hypothetical protein
MTGRPSIYSDELADEICERLASGQSLIKISKMNGMPCFATMFNWLADPSKSGFLDKYTRAREIQAHYMAEEILDIADSVELDWMPDAEGKSRLDHEHIQRSKLRVDSRKWLASKLLPKKYGDRLATTLTGEDGGPVQVSNILEQCRQRAKAPD